MRGLARIYGEGTAAVTALAGVDLDLCAGELIVLLGASGSGKSTLLNQLGGLDSPTHGTLLYRGANLAAFDEAALTRFRRDAVGFVFQAYNLIPSLTARENVALITEICRNPMSPEEALALVGLADRMDHFPAQLSGGEQQRVAIARALMSEPSLMLCDEPTGNLDTRSGESVFELFAQLVAQEKQTIVVVTHDPRLAARTQRIVRLKDGLVVDDTRTSADGSLGEGIIAMDDAKLFLHGGVVRRSAHLAIDILRAGGLIESSSFEHNAGGAINVWESTFEKSTAAPGEPGERALLLVGNTFKETGEEVQQGDVRFTLPKSADAL